MLENLEKFSQVNLMLTDLPMIKFTTNHDKVIIIKNYDSFAYYKITTKFLNYNKYPICC